MSKNQIPPRERIRHPFGKRENFPDLDHVFSKKSSTASNVSTCSNSSYYSLDMSIGARAALADHLRHVAKYGVDGEKPDKGNYECCSSKDRIWNKLVDTSQSFSIENQQRPNVNVTSLDVQNKAAEVSFTNDCTFSSIDTSSDFFNSSKVHLLRTPERNQNRIPKIFTRKEEQELDDDEASIVDQSTSGSFLTQDMAHIFRGAMHFGDSMLADTETSFGACLGRGRGAMPSPTNTGDQENPAIDTSSFAGAMDVSRISAADSICTPQRRGSPSRGLWDEEDEHPWSPFRKVPGSTNSATSSQFVPSWCVSTTPRRSPPKTPDGFTPNKSMSTFLSPLEARAASQALSKMSYMKREKANPFPISITSSSDEYGIPESKNPFLDLRMQDHHLKNIRPPSPIPADVSAIEMNSNCDFPESTTFREGVLGNKGTKPESSKTVKRMEDRRRYRTVVPARVFLQDHEIAHEIRDDSFSMPFSQQ